jgi:hypothetical protein
MAGEEKPMKSVSLACALAVAIVAAVGTQAPATSSGGDLAKLAQWLPGVFDNFQQVSEEREAKTPRPHERIHAVVSRVAVPALGDHVFLVEHSRPDTPSAATALRFHVLAPPTPDGAIVQRVYDLAGEKRAIDPAKDAAWLAGLPAGEFRPLAGCETTWRRKADAFVGSTRPGACRPMGGSDKTSPVTAGYSLNATDFTIDERVVDASGHEAAPAAAPTAMKRARIFTCWTALRKEGSTDTYDGTVDIMVHDQGQMVPIELPAGTPVKYSFELSQLRYANRLPVMKLAIYEAGKEQSVAYTWTEPQGTRIGVNLRWIQVGCSPKTP